MAAQDEPIEGVEQIEAVDLSTVSPEQFATLVQSASSKQLQATMSDDAVRAKVLDEVFFLMRSRYTGDVSASGVIHWKILDKPSGGYDLYETVLSGADCTVHKESTRDPRVIISLSAPEFLRLASGNGSPTMMFFSGKLKLSGDIAFAAGIANLFDIPKA